MISVAEMMGGEYALMSEDASVSSDWSNTVSRTATPPPRLASIGPFLDEPHQLHEVCFAEMNCVHSLFYPLHSTRADGSTPPQNSEQSETRTRLDS